LFGTWWIIGGKRPENCSEAKWATLSKYWNTIDFIKKQAIMNVAWAQVKNPSKLGCGGPTQQEACIVSTLIVRTC
jgi:hypothetical protein